jgi:hypothetical protein
MAIDFRIAEVIFKMMICNNLIRIALRKTDLSS